MSSPTTPNQASPPIDPEIGLIFTAADHHIPLFNSGSIGIPLARQMAVSAIEAYHPETRADYVNVARTIAFSMAALALLGQAASQDMTLPEKMRTFGRANALNRSADQSERSMMQRRRYHQANPPADQPDSSSETPAPDAQLDDAQMQAEIAGAMKEYLATRAQANVKAATPEPTPKAPPESAMPQPAQGTRPAALSATEIRHNGARFETLQPRSTPFGEGLPQQSAMLSAVGDAGVHYPA